MAEEEASAVAGTPMPQVRRSAEAGPHAYVLWNGEGQRVGRVSAVEIPRRGVPSGWSRASSDGPMPDAAGRAHRDAREGGKVLGLVQATDDVVLELDFDLAAPFRTLVVACAIGMDASVSQDD